MSNNPPRRSRVTPTFFKFTVSDIPSESKPWPAGYPEPKPLEAPVECPVEDGFYYSCYADGQLRLLTQVRKGRTLTWLNLEHGTPAGCDTSELVHCAQRYYANGQMEDFNPWNDSDPAYDAPETFESFVRRQLSLYHSASSQRGADR